MLKWTELKHVRHNVKAYRLWLLRKVSKKFELLYEIYNHKQVNDKRRRAGGVNSRPAKSRHTETGQQTDGQQLTK